MSYPKKDWRGPARQFFVGDDNDKDLKVYFLMTQLNFDACIVENTDNHLLMVRLVRDVLTALHVSGMPVGVFSSGSTMPSSLANVRDASSTMGYRKSPEPSQNVWIS